MTVQISTVTLTWIFLHWNIYIMWEIDVSEKGIVRTRAFFHKKARPFFNFQMRVRFHGN